MDVWWSWLEEHFCVNLQIKLEGKQQATMAFLPDKHTVQKILCQLPIDFFILRIPLPCYGSSVQDCMCDTYLHCCLLNDEWKLQTASDNR